MTNQYAEGLKDVLIRKIVRAERDLQQLKMDYCRFVYGISHRTRIKVDEQVYLVKSVDLDSMKRLDSGDWSQPGVSGVMLNTDGEEVNSEVVQISSGWELV